MSSQVGCYRALEVLLSQSQERLKRFKDKNPICYLCGRAPTETIDHFPNRNCFVRRIGPEGFEFPACLECNQATRQVEQVTSFYAHLMDQNESRFEDEGEMLRHVKGIANNFPSLLPDPWVSANEKRAAFRFHNAAYRHSTTFADAPIVRLPDQMPAAFDIFALKMCAALYYRHIGQPISQSAMIASTWRFFTAKDNDQVLSPMIEFLPDFALGKRSNTSIGDQFQYKWGVQEGEPVFAFIALLRRSFVFVGAVVPSIDDPSDMHWKPYGQRFDELWNKSRFWPSES